MGAFRLGHAARALRLLDAFTVRRQHVDVLHRADAPAALVDHQSAFEGAFTVTAVVHHAVAAVTSGRSSRTRISCGHMDVISAKIGQPGNGRSSSVERSFHRLRKLSAIIRGCSESRRGFCWTHCAHTANGMERLYGWCGCGWCYQTTLTIPYSECRSGADEQQFVYTRINKLLRACVLCQQNIQIQ